MNGCWKSVYVILNYRSLAKNNGWYHRLLWGVTPQPPPSPLPSHPTFIFRISFWSIVSFFTELEFCIFSMTMLLQEGERKWVRGRKSGPAPVRPARAKSSKFHISSLNKERKRNGCHFSQFSGLSRLSIALLALASMDTTPVVWRPKEEIEVLDTDHWRCCMLD